MAAVMFAFVSCGSGLDRDRSLSLPRDSMPMMKAWDVETLVSDSGITRYRVNAPVWQVYDRADEPYWLFSDGVHFERFDESYKIEAQVDADSAIYYSEAQKWELIGNVKAMNTAGETFQSEILYVDQKRDRIHTDRPITVTQKDKIIKGLGIESNQSLSKYTILRPTGIFPVDNEDEDGADSLQVQ